LRCRKKVSERNSRCASLNGTAESDGSLDEGDEVDELSVERPIIVNGKPHKLVQAVSDKAGKGLPSLPKPARGLSIAMKFFLICVVIAGCYGFIQMYKPRRSSVAGRHGAYGSYESKAYP